MTFQPYGDLVPATVPIPGLYDSEGTDQNLTLRQCYEKFLLPSIADRADATHSAFRTTLGKHWEPFVGDLPVGDINDQVLNNWWRRLHEAGYSDSLLRKQWANIRRILRKIGPRIYGNSGGQAVIDYIPYLEPPPPTVRRKRIASLGDLSKIYLACSQATYPANKQSPAPLIWCSVFVLSYNFGFRTRDLFGLRWDMIQWSPECPDPDVPVSNVSGWLEFLPRKTRRSRPTPLILPLNAVTRAHLESLRGNRTKVFPCNNRPNDWHRERMLIQQLAGIAEPYTFQDLRVTCNTAWNRLCYGLGRHVLGQAPRGVNETSYLSTIELMCDHIERLPHPAAFQQIFD